MWPWLQAYFRRLDASVIDEDAMFDWIFGLSLGYLGYVFLRGYAAVTIPLSPPTELPMPLALVWLEEQLTALETMTAWLRPYIHALLCWIPAYHFLRRAVIQEEDDGR